MTDTPAPTEEKVAALNAAVEFKTHTPTDTRTVVEIAQTFLSFLKGN